MVHIHVPKYLCDVAHMVRKKQQKRNKNNNIRTNSFVDDQLTCPSLYFVSKFKSWKYVLDGKKHVVYHVIVQEIKFQHMMKSFRHLETFLS